MRSRIAAWLILAALCLSASPAARSAEPYTAERIRDVLSAGVAGSLCAEVNVKWAAWCAVLGVEFANWLDKGVAIVINRHFEVKDQEFADVHGVTICYSDGKCIKPKK